MTMHSLCRSIVADGALATDLAGLARAELGFTREIGVLERHFYQCVQQPHVIWASTEWTSRDAHDRAAAGLMKVRRDDRVASACFRPGLYFEIFGQPLVQRVCEAGDAELVVVCHGLVADASREGWGEQLAQRVHELEPPAGLRSIVVHHNLYAHAEFVAFLSWRDEAAYTAARAAVRPDDLARALSPGDEVSPRTLEERLLVAAPRSDLAAYDQFECRPLVLEPAAG